MTTEGRPGDGTWVVLPTYDEADNIRPVSAAILASLPGATLLVVDDGSPDGTGDIADELAAADPRIRVRHRPAKQGLGRAYLDGFGVALAGGAQRVVQMDADFSHDPAVLPQLLAPLESGRADLVIGSRYVHGGGVENWNLQRRVISLAGCEYARRVLGVGIRDLTGGFKCFRAATLQRINAQTAGAQGYAFQVELTWRTLSLGLKIVEVPIRFRERRLGESKMSAQIALEAAWRVPALRYGPRRWRPPLGVDGRPADPLIHEG
jgi:dolichol-phosphate mannosyltransferase